MLSPAKHHHSIVEASARALWLVEHRLLDERTRDAKVVDAIALRLSALPHIDEGCCRRIAQFCFGPDAEAPADDKPLLLHHVDKLCDALFELHHGVPVFKTEVRLRHISRLLDPDMLVCLYPTRSWSADERYDWAAVALNGKDYSNDALNNGSVDSHIHLGGVLPPLFYWTALMSGEIPLDMLDFSPTDEITTQQGQQTWRAALIDAAYLRLRLAAAVQAPAAKAFSHLPDVEDTQWAPFLGEKQLPSCFAEVRDWTLALSRKQRMALPLERRCCPWVDPLRLDPGRGRGCHYAQGERRLLVAVGQLLRKTTASALADSPSPLLQSQEADLLAYLRLRNALHAKLVHDHGTDGLLRFVRNFDRRRSVFGHAKKWPGGGEKPGAADKPPSPRQLRAQATAERRRRGRRKAQRRALILERQRMAVALEMQLHEAFNDPDPLHANGNAPLRGMEMRVTVPDGNQVVRTLHAWLRGIADFLSADGSLSPLTRHAQVGLVFHFIKLKNASKCEDSAEQQARRLAAVLHDYPGLRRYIVGIDAAGYERYSAPRQFAAAYRTVIKKAADLRPRHREPRIQLGYTYHAGEDADDMLTALRHIDEAVNLLFPAANGGRIGHALLLGEPPASFYRRRRHEAEVALGTHLLDLVWAQGKLAESRCPEHLAWLQQRITNLMSGNSHIDACYGAMREGVDGLVEAKSEAALLKALLSSAEPLHINACYGAMREGVDGLDEAKSEAALLKALGFVGNPAQPITVRVRDQWLPMLASLQNLLHEQLRRGKVCIESNPSSNLLIGGYSEYQDLPYRHLTGAGLPLSLNTDDPGLFFSSLPGEFSAMYHGLAATGMQRRDIVNWLEQRLVDAKRAGFLGHQVPIGAASPVLEEQSMRELMRPCFADD